MENVEQNLAKYNQRLPTRCKTPIMSKYRPETDTSPKHERKEVTLYKEMVRVLRWVVEMRQVNIILETALISTYLALPCSGNLKQVFHVFGYLKANLKRKLFFYPQQPTINECSFSAHDWYIFYLYAKKAIPTEALNPRGNVVSTHCFVDADRAYDRTTRIYQTGGPNIC